MLPRNPSPNRNVFLCQSGSCSSKCGLHFAEAIIFRIPLIPERTDLEEQRGTQWDPPLFQMLSLWLLGSLLQGVGLAVWLVHVPILPVMVRLACRVQEGFPQTEMFCFPWLRGAEDRTWMLSQAWVETSASL